MITTPTEAVKEILRGYVGMIEGLTARISEEFGASMTVIATGGLAPLFAPSVKCIWQVDPHLTLDGLLAVYQLNKS